MLAKATKPSRCRQALSRFRVRWPDGSYLPCGRELRRWQCGLPPRSPFTGICSSATRTGTRCASRTQLKVGFTLAGKFDPSPRSRSSIPVSMLSTWPWRTRDAPISRTLTGSPTWIRGGDLVQERLKDMVVAPIDKEDLDVGPLECARYRDAGKACSDYQNSLLCRRRVRDGRHFRRTRSGKNCGHRFSLHISKPAGSIPGNIEGKIPPGSRTMPRPLSTISDWAIVGRLRRNQCASG